MPEMGLSGSEGGEESSLFPYPYLSTLMAESRLKDGAGDGDRTHDVQLGKLTFYH
jgi:hypothetical protein